MKKILQLWALSVLFVAFTARTEVISYVNHPMAAGDNLFVNPFLAVSNQVPDNHLSNVFSAPPPEGTYVKFWNSDASLFDVTSTYSGGSWSTNLELLPGTGALLHTPIAYTQTFYGWAVSHSGEPLSGLDPLTPPPVMPLANGTYLLGDKYPAVNSGDDVFLFVIGRAPRPGEQFTRLDASQQMATSTRLENGTWDLLPTLGRAEAGFYTIVPEPQTGALLLCGLVVLVFHAGVPRNRHDAVEPLRAD